MLNKQIEGLGKPKSRKLPLVKVGIERPRVLLFLLSYIALAGICQLVAVFLGPEHAVPEWLFVGLLFLALLIANSPRFWARVGLFVADLPLVVVTGAFGLAVGIALSIPVIVAWVVYWWSLAAYACAVMVGPIALVANWRSLSTYFINKYGMFEFYVGGVALLVLLGVTGVQYRERIASFLESAQRVYVRTKELLIRYGEWVWGFVWRLFGVSLKWRLGKKAAARWLGRD